MSQARARRIEGALRALLAAVQHDPGCGIIGRCTCDVRFVHSVAVAAGRDALRGEL